PGSVLMRREFRDSFRNSLQRPGTVALEVVFSVVVAGREKINATRRDHDVGKAACRRLPIESCRKRGAILLEEVHANGDVRRIVIDDDEFSCPTTTSGKLRKKNSIRTTCISEHR